jgi:hypothetical protein
MRRVLLLAVLVAACSDGQKSLLGAEEPFRLRNAQFFEGALPGSAPVPPGTPISDDGPPRIIIFSLTGSLIVTQGQGGKKLPGNATTNTWSIGMTLKNAGTGWWLIPVGDLDSTTNPPTLAFSGIADFGLDIPVGPTSVVGVALDDNGVAGPHLEQPLCIASTGPDGASACPGGSPIPAAAITLTWDTPVDLDLQVLTPDGKLVTSRHPYIDDDDKGDTTKPHIDRDSNVNCVIDGVQRESLIWPTPAQGEPELPSGAYGIYVNLFSPCGQQAVHFRVQVTEAAPSDTGAAGASNDDEMIEKVLFDRAGELVASQTNATDSTGLYVGDYDFPE